jgi:hypothetical protein
MTNRTKSINHFHGFNRTCSLGITLVIGLSISSCELWEEAKLEGQQNKTTTESSHNSSSTSSSGTASSSGTSSSSSTGSNTSSSSANSGSGSTNSSANSAMVYNVIPGKPTGTMITYPKNPKATPLLDDKALREKKFYNNLEEALKEKDQVYRLTLRLPIADLNSLKDIGEFYNLQHLVITSGALKSIPKEIGKLQNLQKLQIDNLLLETPIPLEIGNLKNCKFLSINMDYMEQSFVKQCMQPLHGMYDMTGLETIYLTGDLICNVTNDIVKLTNLEKLHLTKTKMDAIPEQLIWQRLKQYKGFKTLIVKDLPEIKELPEFMQNRYGTQFGYRPRNLPYFSFTNTGISEEKIEHKTWSRKRGRTFYKHTEVLYLEDKDAEDKSTVKCIYIPKGASKFPEVWKNLHTYPNLECIELEFMPKTDYSGPVLPKVTEVIMTGSPDDDNLNLPKHHLDNLIKNTPNLKRLDFSFIPERLPSAITQCKDLVELKFIVWKPSTNWSITLGDDFGKLKKLEEINIFVNTLEYKGSGIIKVSPLIGTLPNLKNLKISADNPNGSVKDLKVDYSGSISGLKKLHEISLGPCIQKPNVEKSLDLLTLHIF